MRREKRKIKFVFLEKVCYSEFNLCKGMTTMHIHNATSYAYFTGYRYWSYGRFCMEREAACALR